MKLTDKVTVISEENMEGLTLLYGKLNTDDLERIINKHIAVAIEEIKEDEKCGC